MWIFFGRKTEVSRVEGGRSFRDKCPECGREARFSECVVEEKLSAYHILELGSDRETVFRCGECGELFRLRDQPGQAKAKRAPQAPAQAPRAAPAADPAAARRAREERERVAQQREAQVDAELAALKKKLGRE